MEDKFLGALVGLATGDALGTTNEFMPPHSIKTPVTELVGGGKFRLLPGMVKKKRKNLILLVDR
jgi:ADP-ribosyl-[dinitrogen reductase] hydrolase